MSFDEAIAFCEWLSAKTGTEWRLPTNAEWEEAVGTSKYPWGDYFPPKWDDGNYALLEDGNEDPLKFGADGIKGTSPVGSFKPNALGFYDLGGNVWEWMGDGFKEGTEQPQTRGGGWLKDRTFTIFLRVLGIKYTRSLVREHFTASGSFAV
jgi:formylglycine-generating enzyme required for sulfatase activity